MFLYLDLFLNKYSIYYKIDFYYIYTRLIYSMSTNINFLIHKQWGYQTICPNEEDVTGLYQLQEYNVRTIYAWKRPSLKSEKHNIASQRLVSSNQIWGWDEKYNRNDNLNWVKISKKPIYWMPRVEFTY